MEFRGWRVVTLVVLICALLALKLQHKKVPDTIVIVPTLTNDEKLVEYGRQIGIITIQTGEINEVLQRAAEEHAQYQASKQLQGHQLWSARMATLQQRLPGLSFQEIANQSWEHQSAEETIKEFYRSWKLSPGHWEAAMTPCKFYGYSMRLGQNGIWYAAAIFGRVK